MQSLFSKTTSFFHSVTCISSPAYQRIIWIGQQPRNSHFTMWLHVPPDAVGTCNNDGHSKQGRMRPTRVVPEALGLMKATQGELSLLWGRLLQNCQILFPGVGTRCLSAIYVTSRKNFPEYASALAHLRTLQRSKLVFLISHKLWFN